MNALPCGGLGLVDPKASTMDIVCTVHRLWERDEHGRVKTELIAGELRYVCRDTPGCGAITEASTGVRRIVGYVTAEERAA